MSELTRKISAGVLLAFLIVVPFINWQLGAVLWMCAWLIYIFQNLFPRHDWKFGGEDENGDRETRDQP